MLPDSKDDFCRIVLVLLNCVFLMCGALVITLGIYSYRSSNASAGMAVEKDSSIILMWIGLVIFSIALWGCFGAFCQNVCMLCVYSAILLVVVGIELTFFVLAYLARDKVRPITEKSLRDTIKNYFKRADDKKRWDNLQNKFKCCGIASYKDWKDVPGATGKIPVSCGDEAKTRPGCLDRILKEFETLEVYFKIGAIFVAVIETFGIILACCVSTSRQGSNSLPRTPLA